MRRVFADTHFWVAISRRTDADHAAALFARVALGEAVVETSDEVLAEYLAYHSAGDEKTRRFAAQVVRDVLSDPDIRVWPQSRDGFLAALELFEQRPDKGYSLVDCRSMNLMRELGITDVLTRDRHFAQEGFNVLIKA